MFEKILNRVIQFFRESNDFNGILLYNLRNEMEIAGETFIPMIEKLITEEKISLQFEALAINPHIIRIKHYPIDVQLDYLKNK